MQSDIRSFRRALRSVFDNSSKTSLFCQSFQLLLKVLVKDLSSTFGKLESEQLKRLCLGDHKYGPFSCSSKGWSQFGRCSVCLVIVS